jgi:DHA2 family multidrug resistance protein
LAQPDDTKLLQVEAERSFSDAQLVPAAFRDLTVRRAAAWAMLQNLGGAFGTALLATIVTKREQFHSDVINSSVTLLHDAARQRTDDLTAYFMSHGVSDPAAAQQKAFVALGEIIRKQAMIMGYSDTFAVLGGLLLLAAALILATRKGQASGAGGH